MKLDGNVVLIAGGQERWGRRLFLPSSRQVPGSSRSTSIHLQFKWKVART